MRCYDAALPTALQIKMTNRTQAQHLLAVCVQCAGWYRESIQCLSFDYGPVILTCVITNTCALLTLIERTVALHGCT